MTAVTALSPAAPAPERERTKRRLLDLVKRHGPQTAQDLAARLEISIPAARRHLCDLQEQGLVEARVEKPGGRGRPQHVFALTDRGEAAFPKTYSLLCVDVLRHVQSLYGEGAVLRVLDARNAEIAARLAPELCGSALPERLELLAQRLTEMGFDARLERDPVEPGVWFLVQHNCPNLTVARQYQDLCAAELDLYGALLGVPVVRESRIACGQSTCRYRIGPGSA
ncbi:helix-turn-helix transcriptional regulator [Deinococcus taklimakanensis]|uniref:Helix-turn-helix transcriptional regulator n=1 Tax=Deinococcus taklimakanensis TaxID=536443 RepID=A0ABW5P3I4_9DEIO